MILHALAALGALSISVAVLAAILAFLAWLRNGGDYPAGLDVREVSVLILSSAVAVGVVSILAAGVAHGACAARLVGSRWRLA
jgi:hypothetical protein